MNFLAWGLAGVIFVSTTAHNFNQARTNEQFSPPSQETTISAPAPSQQNIEPGDLGDENEFRKEIPKENDRHTEVEQHPPPENANEIEAQIRQDVKGELQEAENEVEAKVQESNERFEAQLQEAKKGGEETNPNTPEESKEVKTAEQGTNPSENTLAESKDIKPTEPEARTETSQGVMGQDIKPAGHEATTPAVDSGGVGQTNQADNISNNIDFE